MNRISEPVRQSQAASLLPHLHNLAPNFTPPATALPPKNLQLDIYMGGRCPICSASLDKIANEADAAVSQTHIDSGWVHASRGLFPIGKRAGRARHS